jgi:DNA-binding winged helix-turn-helix (wHTH) protein/TolB-like protein
MVTMARVHFGLFDFNSDTGELLREGRAVHLQAQPGKALALLISARGEVVTREAFRNALWDEGTSVDFDRSLNFAIAQVRTALGDSAESPTFIRTVPKLGYQFIAPVSEQPAQRAPVADAALAPAPIAEVRTPRRRVLPWLAAAAVSAALAGLVVLRGKHTKEARIAVARFQNETGNPALDRFADTLTDSVVAGLTSETVGRFGVIGNAAILRRARSFQDIDEIASALKAQYVILGQVQQDGPRVRLLAHLIRLPEKTHLKVSGVEVDSSASESQLAKHIVDDFTRRLDSPPAATN